MITSPAPTNERKIKRPVVSEEDGTREGGLVFPIVFIIGFVLASMAHPAALASFWVWFVLLMMSIAFSVSTQRLVARLNGFDAKNQDDAKGPL